MLEVHTLWGATVQPRGLNRGHPAASHPWAPSRSTVEAWLRNLCPPSPKRLPLLSAGHRATRPSDGPGSPKAASVRPPPAQLAKPLGLLGSTPGAPPGHGAASSRAGSRERPPAFPCALWATVLECTILPSCRCSSQRPCTRQGSGAPISQATLRTPAPRGRDPAPRGSKVSEIGGGAEAPQTPAGSLRLGSAPGQWAEPRSRSRRRRAQWGGPTAH